MEVVMEADLSSLAVVAPSILVVDLAYEVEVL
jgi:hypothetical protein